MTINALWIVALAAAQDPQQDPQNDLPPPHDFAVGVAGNELVLRTDLDIQIHSDDEMFRRFQSASTADERSAIQIEALVQRLETLVMVQAGADLGFDPELVEDLTENEFEQRIERLGGHRAASQIFAEWRTTPEQYKRQIQDRLLAESWKRSRIGRAPGPTGRYAVDRFVRPGLMRIYYDSFIDSEVRAEREAIGQVDERVRIQLLQVNVPVGADPEQTREAVEVIVDVYETGADFGRLVVEHGDASFHDQRGMLRPAPVGIFAVLGEEQHGGPDLGELAIHGEVGATTPPLWFETRGADGQVRTRAWRVYRLAERIAPSPPLPFESQELQTRLREYLLQIFDEPREEAAFLGALRDTHIWREGLREGILEARANKRRR